MSGRAVRAIAVLAAAALVASPAATAEPPATTVSELVVTATKAVSELTVTAEAKCLRPQITSRRAEQPRIVDVFPARGATVRPGLLVVRVTFDRPMACEGTFDADPPLANPCPGGRRQMLLSYDRKTVRTVCVVEAATQYGFSVGQDPNAATFLALEGGLPAAPAKIAFATSSDAPVTDVCHALAQDPVTAAQLKARGKACAG
jgi:hypothetical protein